MIRSAFNAMTRLHSRPVQLKRFGDANGFDIYSPGRITPSNVPRNLDGPEHTTIAEMEFIIPTDTLLGEEIQLIKPATVPTAGAFKITYQTNSTSDLSFDATASDVQTALRLVAGLSNVVVTGDSTAGYTVNMSGVAVSQLLAVSNGVTPLDTTVAVTFVGYTPWNPILRKGDKIIDPIKGHLAVTQITEIFDFGATSIMGYRVKAE